MRERDFFFLYLFEYTSIIAVAEVRPPAPVGPAPYQNRQARIQGMSGPETVTRPAVSAVSIVAAVTFLATAPYCLLVIDVSGRTRATHRYVMLCADRVRWARRSRLADSRAAVVAHVLSLVLLDHVHAHANTPELRAVVAEVTAGHILSAQYAARMF